MASIASVATRPRSAEGLLKRSLPLLPSASKCALTSRVVSSSIDSCTVAAVVVVGQVESRVNHVSLHVTCDCCLPAHMVFRFSKVMPIIITPQFRIDCPPRSPPRCCHQWSIPNPKRALVCVGPARPRRPSSLHALRVPTGQALLIAHSSTWPHSSAAAAALPFRFPSHPSPHCIDHS